jgi:hypothetical protein
MNEVPYLRYLGCLGLLGLCAVYVPDELREQIEAALRDAVAHDKHLRFKRVLNSMEVEVVR